MTEYFLSLSALRLLPHLNQLLLIVSSLIVATESGIKHPVRLAITLFPQVWLVDAMPTSIATTLAAATKSVATATRTPTSHVIFLLA